MAWSRAGGRARAHTSHCPDRLRCRRCGAAARGDRGRGGAAGGSHGCPSRGRQGTRPGSAGAVGPGVPAQRRRARRGAGQRSGPPGGSARRATSGRQAARGGPRCRRGRAARARGRADVRRGPMGVLLPDDGRRQPDREEAVRRRPARPDRGAALGDPSGREHPQRRAPRLRPERPPVRHHRGRASRPPGPDLGLAGAGLGLAGRQDPAAQPRRVGPGRQPEGQLRLDQGAPQRRGHHVGRPRPDVGHGSSASAAATS